MKRLTKQTKQRQIRLMFAAMGRRKKINAAAEARRKNKKEKKLRDIKDRVAYIRAPSVFDIARNNQRDPLIAFIHQLRTLFFSSKKHSRITIDFRQTTKFVSPGTLLFYAEIQRLMEITHYRIELRCTPPQNELASQVLDQIGIYGICKHTHHQKPAHRDVVHWRVAHGRNIDPGKYAPAIEAHEGKLAEPLLNGVFRGLAEATANAVEHAYEGIRDDGLNVAQANKDWWVFSQSKDGELFVALCDLGIGIPRTLPIKRSGTFNRLKEKLGFTPSDSDCIEAAIEDSRTRTGKAERGKGLGNIIEAVSRFNGSALIFSNQGAYVLHAGKESKRNYNASILGTLIIWSVPLPSGTGS